MQNITIAKKIKSNIKKLIDLCALKESRLLINEYKKVISNDIEIYSAEAIIYIMENRLNDAEECLYKGLAIDKLNFNLLYNLAYLYGIKKEKELELEFHKKALTCCYVVELQKVIINRICDLKSNINFKIDKKIINNNQNLIKEIDSENNIIKDMKELIKDRRFLEVLAIFYYYLKHSKACIGKMYYFAGYACCGLKKFEESIKYHNISIRIEPNLSNLVDKSNIVTNYNFDEEKVNCIGCNYDDFDIVNVSNQSISESNKGIINPIRIWVKCKKCNLVYGNPLPSENVLSEYYSIIAKEKFGGLYGDIKDREEFLFEMSGVRLDNIRKLTDKKTLLDIGTGIGFFVKAALDKGYNAYGLELTPEDCDYAKKNYGLDLMQRNFYSFTEDEKYDIVTMFEVIEHMRSPLKDLKRINKLVKKGGIFVIATPILNSEYAKKTKESNVFWGIVAHLSYFTKEVLIEYLELAGFKVISIADSLEGMGRQEFYCKKIISVD